MAKIAQSYSSSITGIENKCKQLWDFTWIRKAFTNRTKENNNIRGKRNPQSPMVAW